MQPFFEFFSKKRKFFDKVPSEAYQIDSSAWISIRSARYSSSQCKLKESRFLSMNISSVRADI